MVISSTDRAIRTFQVSPLTGVLNPIHRFQDLVNRTPWHAVGFSGDSEYVMGGAGHKMAHNVFVWDRDSGVLVKVLEGPKEPLIHCDVSPNSPLGLYPWCWSSTDLFLYAVAPDQTGHCVCRDVGVYTSLANHVPGQLGCVCAWIRGARGKCRV